MLGRIVVLALIAAFGSGITIGSAASLGTGLSSETIAAGTVDVSACGKGAVFFDYAMVDPGSGYVVDKVNLRRGQGSGSSWIAPVSCVGLTVRIALGGTEVLNRSLTSGDVADPGANRVLQLDVTDVPYTAADRFAVLIH